MEDGQGHIPQHPFEGHSIPKQVYQTLPAGAAAQQAGQWAEWVEQSVAAGRNSEK